ncbi:DUF1850 domain-containing protein [Fictibacillus iocasae]|uniref:DUF1850 domain-containing protein n=1 Tax=Fictibacillus iocasae TaxID=2715437 RepID=A0ABW2NLU6_9BACL
MFEDGQSGSVVAYEGLGSSNRFQIKYTHSIHRTPVIETYIVKSGFIVQKSIAYKNFGVGMPENAGKGERFRKVKDMYVLDRMNREFPYIDLRTGRVIADHVLIVKGEKKHFSTIVKPGTWVRIQYGKINLWNILKGGSSIENKSGDDRAAAAGTVGEI